MLQCLMLVECGGYAEWLWHVVSDLARSDPLRAPTSLLLIAFGRSILAYASSRQEEFEFRRGLEKETRYADHGT